jgi:hypothetical protein
MSKKTSKKLEKNILKENIVKYGFAQKSEIDKLKEDVLRSDKEKFLLFTQMLRRNATLKKAVIALS